MAAELRRDDLAAVIGSTFTAADLVLELVEVTPAGHQGGFESFTATFRSRQPFIAPQATYPLAHPHLGEHELFIVPIAADADGVVYEACFNRLAEAAG